MRLTIYLAKLLGLQLIEHPLHRAARPTYHLLHIIERLSSKRGQRRVLFDTIAKCWSGILVSSTVFVRRNKIDLATLSAVSFGDRSNYSSNPNSFRDHLSLCLLLPTTKTKVPSFLVHLMWRSCMTLTHEPLGIIHDAVTVTHNGLYGTDHACTVIHDIVIQISLPQITY